MHQTFVDQLQQEEASEWPNYEGVTLLFTPLHRDKLERDVLHHRTCDHRSLTVPPFSPLVLPLPFAQWAQIGGHEDISHVLNIARFFKSSNCRKCFNHLKNTFIKDWQLKYGCFIQLKSQRLFLRIFLTLHPQQQ